MRECTEARLLLVAECQEYRDLVGLLARTRAAFERDRTLTDYRLTELEARTARVIGRLSRLAAEAHPSPLRDAAS